jgi:outer membrane protein assembly factor BamD
MIETMKRCTFVHSVVFALAVAGCASSNVKHSDDVEAIYKEATSLIERGRFIEAGEYLTEIRTRFPQSRYAPLAELRAADMQYDQENFTEAAAAYGVFVELYPNHPDAAYALYRKALSYHDDAPDKPARDQAPAAEAAKTAEQLIQRYPNSEYATKARELYKQSRLKLAEKEAYVARFYERKNSPLAAYRRWEGLRVGFGDLKDIEQGKALLAEAETKSKQLAGPAAEFEAKMKAKAESTN